ncbi:MAG: hypothetical protein ACLT5B_07270 [Clostridia bacterium]
MIILMIVQMKNTAIVKYEYLGDIEQAVTIRNRLAHGQWKIQLNSNESNLASEEITSFFERYDNIQKLDLLYKVYKLIAEIISSYVVYKDKVLTNNFKQEIKDKIFQDRELSTTYNEK